jgi:hypothetical protein
MSVPVVPATKGSGGLVAMKISLKVQAWNPQLPILRA